MLPVQQFNVVNAIRTDGLHSRTDLASRLGYSRASMTTVIKDLIDRNIITETSDGASTGGRRAKMLDFNHQFANVIGIDLGATSVDIALADFRGTILVHRHEALDVRDGPEIVLDRVLTRLFEMLHEHHIDHDSILSIGIGVPGPVDFAEGMLIVPPIMPGWNQYPIRRTFLDIFPKATIIVDNDVNVMAMGELRLGVGRGIENFLFVKVGTGIGCGIVVHGQVYRGATGSAGDIGHIQAESDGPVCHCGNIGCIEAMASGSAIARQAVQLAEDGSSPILAQYLSNGVSKLTAEHVGLAAHEGDIAAMEIIKSSGTRVGQVLAGVVNFFNPSLILIGGGVSNIGTQFLATIRQGILARSLPLSTEHLRIDYSHLGDDAGITGATALALEHVFIAAT